MVEKDVEIDAPVEEVFAYVDDFSKAPEWLYGLTRIEPVDGEPSHGLGATFDGTMKLGVALHSTIKCVGWEQDRLIEIDSIKGIKNTQRWTFEPLGDDRCRVHAYVTCELPGGPAGKAMDRAVKPFVGIAVTQTTKNLVSRFEG